MSKKIVKEHLSTDMEFKNTNGGLCTTIKFQKINKI